MSKYKNRIKVSRFELSFTVLFLLLNINNLPYSDRCFNTDWPFETFKREKPMDMILVSVYFRIGFLNFSNIYCWYTLKLCNSHVHLQHMPIQ